MLGTHKGMVLKNEVQTERVNTQLCYVDLCIDRMLSKIKMLLIIKAVDIVFLHVDFSNL